MLCHWRIELLGVDSLPVGLGARKHHGELFIGSFLASRLAMCSCRHHAAATQGVDASFAAYSAKLASTEIRR
jgi:hypothetical protein